MSTIQRKRYSSQSSSLTCLDQLQNSSKLEHVGSNSAQFPIVEHGHNFVYSTSLELRVGAEIAIDAIIQSRFLIVIYNHNRRLFRFDTYIHSNGTGNREEIHFLMSIREEFGVSGT